MIEAIKETYRDDGERLPDKDTLLDIAIENEADGMRDEMIATLGEVPGGYLDYILNGKGSELSKDELEHCYIGLVESLQTDVAYEVLEPYVESAEDYYKWEGRAIPGKATVVKDAIGGAADNAHDMDKDDVIDSIEGVLWYVAKGR